MPPLAADTVHGAGLYWRNEMTDFETDTMPDLFEHTDTLPADVRERIADFSELLESGDSDGYALCHDLLAYLVKRGFTCDFGLDGVPYSLLRISL